MKSAELKNSELKEYLNGFPDNAKISVIIVNPKERKYYPVTAYGDITDMGQPVFALEVGASERLEDKKGIDVPGQIDFSDFPEVL